MINMAAKIAARTIIAVKTFPLIEEPNAVDLIVIEVLADNPQGSVAFKVISVVPSFLGIPLSCGIDSTKVTHSGVGSREYVSSSPS